MNKLTKKAINTIALVLLTVSSNTVIAKVIPATIFADNMVLQQRQSAQAIWGSATPNKTIKIKTSWDNRTYSTQSDKEGHWKSTINTPIAGGPYSITFYDGEKTVLNNILIGEVWICSGQSNMEMPMKGFSGQPLEPSTNIDILNSNNSNIRLFNVAHNPTINPQNDIKGNWQTATPASVKEFSATGYYFGRLLQQNLNIPIGLIACHWGGSSIEAWMSGEMLSDYPDIILPKTTTNIKKPQIIPTLLYNGMLHPLIGLNIQGIIWYQGENNVPNYSQYTSLFQKFVTSIRKEWNLGDFPFYYCQIAPYSYYKDNSAFLREAQAKTENSLPNMGMAVLLDAGLKGCIHPQKKQIAGERLALQALARTYGKDGFAFQSPNYKSMEIQNDTIIVQFDNAPMGLTSYYKALQNFTVAGDDKKFYPAKAWIKNNQVFLISENVKYPIAVRYAFENFVEGDLFSVEGLPVSSFRTDNF